MDISEAAFAFVGIVTAGGGSIDIIAAESVGRRCSDAGDTSSLIVFDVIIRGEYVFRSGIEVLLASLRNNLEHTIMLQEGE